MSVSVAASVAGQHEPSGQSHFRRLVSSHDGFLVADQCVASQMLKSNTGEGTVSDGIHVGV